MQNPPTIDESTDFQQLFFDYLTGQFGNELGYHTYPGYLEILEIHRDLGPGPVRDRLEAAILDMLRPGFHFPGSRGMPLTWPGPHGEEMLMDVDKDDWTLQWYAVTWSQSLKLKDAVPRLAALLQNPYYQGGRPDQEYTRGFAENVLKELSRLNPA